MAATPPEPATQAAGSDRPDPANAGSQQEGAETCRLTVYYDGACPLCRREIGYYRERAPHQGLAWVDVSKADAGALGPDLAQTDAMSRFHVREADGRLLSGADAFGQLWLAMPGRSWRWLGRFVSHPWLLPWAERLYRLFLRVRPTMQRMVSRTRPVEQDSR